MTETDNDIRLTLKGSHAERGVSLGSFEAFIEGFLGALRAFQREERGVSPSKAGNPERAAVVATAFRIVRLEPGSAIATLEPESVDGVQDQHSGAPLFDQVPPQVENLRNLLQRIEKKESLRPPVTTLLDEACKALGAGGTIGVSGPGVRKEKTDPVVIDRTTLDQLAVASSDDLRVVETIAGNLHRLDLEPDKIGIRSADGADWTCSYPAELEEEILGLVGRVVWARGEGRLLNPRRGTMEIETIQSAEPGDQPALFARQPRSDAELAEEQGIEGPQGLDRLGSPEWTDEDDAYLAALTEG